MKARAEMTQYSSRNTWELRVSRSRWIPHSYCL